MKSIGQTIFAFFEDYLKAQKGLRPGSVRSYRDTLKLFLAYVASSRSRPITTACPSGLVGTASSRLPEHDGGHAGKPREHAKPATRRPAYLLSVSCPSKSGDTG